MADTEKKPLIVIEGPTAVGKSELAAELARRINGEVISADSMQVYRYMDIGSAKVTLEEMLGVPHYMIDVLDPTEEMDVARYAVMAKNCLEQIYQRGRMPVLCGGTGFYIQAVTRDIDFTEAESDTKLRDELKKISVEQGNEALHHILRELDPEAANEIHPNNVKRVIRAIEFFKTTGKRISEHNEEEHLRESPYDLVTFFVDDEREKLYRRIDERVGFMRAAGLEEEAAYLRAMGLKRSDVSMQGIGYKEILDAMDGAFSMDDAFELIRLNSRHYAKRQETWFKRDASAIHLIRSDFGGDTFRILDKMLQIVAEHYHITVSAVENPNT